MSESQAVKDYFAKVMVHARRFDAMLDYLDSTLNAVVTAVESAPLVNMVRAAETVWCIKASAPMTKVYEYLTNGAIVYALVGTQAALNNAAIVQVVSSIPGLTKIRAQDKEPIALTNPSKFILALFFFEAGG